MKKMKSMVIGLIMTLVLVTGVLGINNDTDLNASSGQGVIQLNDFSQADGDWLIFKTADTSEEMGKVRLVSLIDGEEVINTQADSFTNSGNSIQGNFETGNYRLDIECANGYSASLACGGQNLELTAKEGTQGEYYYEFQLSPGSVMVFLTGFMKANGNQNQPGEEPEKRIDIQFEGSSTVYDVTTNGVIKVDNSVNLGDLKFQVLKLYQDVFDDGTDLTRCGTVDYIPNAEGINPLEVRVNQSGENFVVINIENHTDPMFYFTNITIAKSDAHFIGVESELHPFMLDSFVVPDKIALSTTADSAGVYTSYYGANTVSLRNIDGEVPATKLEIVDDIASGAIIVDGLDVTFNSGYYNTVVLKVTLEDGTVGYVRINRIGIEIGERDFADNGSENNCAMHGSQYGPNLSSPELLNKHVITASFYFDGSTGLSEEDFDMVCTVTFSNGESEVYIREGLAVSQGDPTGMEGILVADYVVWAGLAGDAPVSVSVTAVKHGALSDDSVFGGASFGAGLGVTKTFEAR